MLTDHLRHVETRTLSIGYAELDRADGSAVLFVHGWPYDIHTYVDVAPILAGRGFRVIVPYQRGFGTTRFRDEAATRNAQQATLALDVLNLMDALGIKKATLAGVDWGARVAACVGELWPERCAALVLVSGYLITSQAIGNAPLAPAAEQSWWYQFYFATERGRLGYDLHRRDLARLIWSQVSPQWRFDEATFEHSARAFDSPDHVATVVHNYRWRIGLADGDPSLEHLEARLARAPTISVPTTTLKGDANGAPHPDPATYSDKFMGRYEHRMLAGIGHNLPQEAPTLFADAVAQTAI